MRQATTTNGIKGIVAGSLGLLLGAGGVSAQTATNYWTGGGAGAFTNDNSWSAAAAPLTDEDHVRFTNDFATVITFTGNVTNHGARVLNTGPITWDLGGYEYHLVSAVVSPQRDVRGIAYPFVLGGATRDGDLTVSNGLLRVVGTFLLGGAHAGAVPGPRLTLSGTNTSLVVVNRSSADRAIGVWGSTVARMVVTNGARATFPGVHVGYGGGNRGVLEIAGAGSVFSNSTARIGFYGHGSLVVADGGHMQNSASLILNHATRGTHDGSSTIVIDGGTIAASNLSNGGGGGGGDTNAHFHVTLHAGQTNALIALSGNLTIRDGFKFYLDLNEDFGVDDEDYKVEIGDVFTIIGVSGTSTGQFLDPENDFAPLAEGAVLTRTIAEPVFGDRTYDFQVSYTGGASSKDFTLTVIPEPATLGLLGLSVLFLIRRRRNKP